MNIRNDLSYRNLIKRPGRSIALTLITAFLSLSLFGGALLVSSMQDGLASLRNRLGADIMVVPYEATTKSNLSNILLQGSMGYFYMDQSVYDKIAAMDGVGQISAQFFLSTLSSGCCSIPVQIIGIDPKTDFTILPWIRDSFKGTMGAMDVVVGNDLNAFPGDTLRFYDTEVKVIAKLKKTGTALDTAVYANEDTVKRLIQASISLNLNTSSGVDPEKAVSCVLINVKDGYDVEDVLNDINIHVRKVEAIRTKNMISDVSDSLKGVSKLIGVMVGIIWIMAVIILGIVFSMSVNERKKEFAVLRTIGASGKRVSLIVMKEGIYVGIVGSLVGIIVAYVLITAFASLIENMLGLPFLLPGAGHILLLAIAAFCITACVCALSCLVMGKRISGADIGYLLREVE